MNMNNNGNITLERVIGKHRIFDDLITDKELKRIIVPLGNKTYIFFALLQGKALKELKAKGIEDIPSKINLLFSLLEQNRPSTRSKIMQTPALKALLDMRYWFHKEINYYTIPTLEEMLRNKGMEDREIREFKRHLDFSNIFETCSFYFNDCLLDFIKMKNRQ